ncbi:MAG TPA: hypothetical protein VK544_00600 [Gemmatimonadaceae bacterium]|jgi:hypothetical protein|nr:hypothetical protein [Gemmatimonadaceae bacterium]
MLKQPYLVCSAALLLAVAACNDSTGTSASISQADANQLAADIDAVSTLGAADFGQAASFSVSVDPSGASASVASAPFPINTQFTVTKQCPRGGQVVIAGGITGTGDRTTHDLSLEAVATRTDTDCAFNTRDGVLTLNGNPNIAYDGKLNIVNGALSGLQTQTHKGSFMWARTGGSGTCDVDLSSSFDPATHTVTVTGTFCGRTVNVTRTRAS